MTTLVASFHEQWFAEPSQVALSRLVENVADVDGLLVEFGAWEGRSTCAMANAAHPRIVQSVDTWRGSPGEVSEELAGKRDVFAQWLANVAYYTRGNVRAHRMGWRQYMHTIPGQRIALAFIDAEHSYVEVHDNIAALLPHMASGGIICGDDNHHPPIRQALADTLGPFEEAATLWAWRAP
jgi:hypothetical protein